MGQVKGHFGLDAAVVSDLSHQFLFGVCSMDKLKKLSPWSTALAVICGLIAAGLHFSITKTQAVSGPVAQTYFDAFWAAVSGGAAFSIPGAISLVSGWIKKFPQFSGDKRITAALDTAQIGAYLFLLDKAKSPEESASLLAAGRASCDSLRDGLFPLRPIIVEATATTLPPKVLA